jgi:hypothetical protein
MPELKATANAGAEPAQPAPGPQPAEPKKRAKKGVKGVKVTQSERPVVYEKLCVNGVEIPLSALTITAALAKELLDWQTEEEFIQRQIAENPGVAAAHRAAKADDAKRIEARYEYLDRYLLRDMEGRKVRAFNNNRNRPLTPDHYRELAQSILLREWHFNGETIIVGRTGEVESGQHRLIALIFAADRWRLENKEWIELWPEEPTIQSLVATGTSEDTETIQTLDNVRTRSLSDVFFTSGDFSDILDAERADLIRMQAKAIDYLWKRLGMSSEKVVYERGILFQTHQTSIRLRDDHPRIVECIKLIRGLNEGRTISTLGLSPGQVATLLYLMGCSSSDAKAYREHPEPSEKLLSWDRWKQALAFWTSFAKEEESTKAVRDAMKMLQAPEAAVAGITAWKSAVLCRAWTMWLDKGRVTRLGEADTLKKLAEKWDLSTKFDDDRGAIQLTKEGQPTLGGIDVGQAPEKVEEEAPPPVPGTQEFKDADREQRIRGMQQRLLTSDGGRPEVQALKRAKLPPSQTVAEPRNGPANGNGPAKPPAPKLIKKPGPNGGPALAKAPGAKLKVKPKKPAK